MPERIVYGKDHMSVGAVNQLKGHAGGTVDAVFVSTGRTELRMAAERDKFQFTTMRASIHGTAKRRIPTVNHLRDVFHHNSPGMKSILNYFIIVFENFLQYIHKTIMKQKKEKENP